jgi:hypothetical protein
MLTEENNNTNQLELHISNQDIFFVLSNIKSAEYTDTSCIASLFLPKDTFILDTSITINALQILNVPFLSIFYITNNENILNNYTRESSFQAHNTKLVFYIISLENFQKALCRPNFNNINPHSLFILNDIKWSTFVMLAKTSENSISVSGGSNNKRHIISKLDSRINAYLLAMVNLDLAKLNSYNDFDLTSKDRFLPFYDFSDKKTSKITDSSGKITIIPNVFTKQGNKNISLNNDKGGFTPPVTNVRSITKREFHSCVHCNYRGNRILNSLDLPVVDKTNTETSILTYLNDIESMLRLHKNVNNNDLILKDETNAIETQYKIESTWIELMKNKLDDPKNHAWGKLPSLITKVIKIIDLNNEKGIIKKRFKPFSSEFMNNKTEIALLSISILISFYDKISVTNLSIQLGERVSFLLYKNSLKYSPEDEDPAINPKLAFEKWKIKSMLNSKRNLLKLGDFLVNLFTQEPTAIFEMDINDDYEFSNSETVLRVSEDYIDSIKENLIVHPNSLPMICPPLIWGDNKYGGFLENEKECNDIVVGSKQHEHKLEKRDATYKAVNNSNTTKFCVNTDLLDYVNNEGSYLIEEKLKDEKNKLQTIITLKIAKIYSDVVFYLNTNCDWRGRIYTNSFFLSYQGGDLSRSLVQFAEGEILNELGLEYLYLCGATYYGLNKYSINYRINWVKKNISLIVSLDKEFINKASENIQFASFCLAVKKYHEDNNTLIKIPIILDATCSGLQHLAVMLKDERVGALVNLVEKGRDDVTSDIYQSLVAPINKNINEYGKDKKNNLPLLEDVELTRDILKVSIMTQIYNVKISGIYSQLKSKFEKVIVKDSENEGKGKDISKHKGITKYKDITKYKGITKYKVPCKNGTYKILEYIYVYKMAELIKNIVLDVYPSLRNIYNYFMDMTKLMTSLNLPIVWFTPVGTEITQSYMLSKTEKVSLTHFGKTRTAVFREWTGIKNKIKQVLAIIPNIIHSLDASHLVAVINTAKDNNISSIVSVHDCFGTHPNKMAQLSNIVRSEFVKLYSQSNFLHKYHDRIIQTITDNNFEIIELKGKKYVVDSNKTKFLIPQLPPEGELDINKINKAILMIN